MNNTEQASSGEESAPQKIGYGNPPLEHRFKKGQSGNPKGRPKKAKRKKPTPDAYSDARMFSKLLQSETKRKIKVKDGDGVEEITVLEATVRSLGVAAMKGGRLAQRDLIKLAQDDEDTRREAIGKEMKKIAEYRLHYPNAMKMIQQQGITEENFLHHPDDMIINPETGARDANGPMTLEQKKDWDKMLHKRDQFAQSIGYLANEYRKAVEQQDKEGVLGFWHHEQKMFDILNDNFPKRYRTELVDRSIRDGASQPGDQKTKHWPGEDD